jgi:tetratricopeptide (TPR) repeat protein
MAVIYRAIGQAEEALHCSEEALPIYREMGDHITESETLSNIAYLLQKMQRYEEAIIAFQKSIAIDRQTPHPAGESAGLVSLALLLYQDLSRPDDAKNSMKQAIATLENADLSQDAAGRTLEELQSILQLMQAEASLTPGATMSAEVISTIVSNTIVVMTTMREHHDQWRKQIAESLQEARGRGRNWQVDVYFFTAILEILDGRQPSLPDTHPYAQAVTRIQEGIAAESAHDDDSSAGNGGTAP